MIKVLLLTFIVLLASVQTLRLTHQTKATDIVQDTVSAARYRAQLKDLQEDRTSTAKKGSPDAKEDKAVQVSWADATKDQKNGASGNVTNGGAHSGAGKNEVSHVLAMQSQGQEDLAAAHQAQQAMLSSGGYNANNYEQMLEGQAPRPSPPIYPNPTNNLTS